MLFSAIPGSRGAEEQSPWERRGGKWQFRRPRPHDQDSFGFAEVPEGRGEGGPGVFFEPEKPNPFGLGTLLHWKFLAVTTKMLLPLLNIEVLFSLQGYFSAVSTKMLLSLPIDQVQQRLRSAPPGRLALARGGHGARDVVGVFP